MAWWRQKADEHHGEDNILDLDTIVWRGINQFDRMHRLAEAAQQAEKTAPEVSAAPMKPLPTVPLPVQAATEDASAPLTDEAAIIKALEEEADNRSPQEEMIEEEIRQQIISDAMSAVLAFQDGSSKTTAPTPEQDDAINQQLEAKLEANVEQELHDHLDTYTPAAPVPAGPDMSGAIRGVIADEIGLWLKDNMARIVAETLTQKTPEPAIAAEHAQQPAQQPAATKSAPKAAPKAAPKTAPKTQKKAAAKARPKAAPKTVK
ncbi:MAG: hypothetical protein J4F41_09565, partial [Alphaproteobacteria bacterium]|nr:hypothetical protein [Alphaproteobacteria bacterium]